MDLAQLLASMQAQTPEKLPPWINLRAPRPAPAPGFDVAALLQNMFSGDALAVPGAVPEAVPPWQTPDLMPKPTIAPEVQRAALASMVPTIPAAPPMTEAQRRGTAPLPMRRDDPVTPPQVSGQPSPGTIKWGLPAATPRGGKQSMVIGAPSTSFADTLIGVESGGNTNARNSRSSAAGLGQFLDSTWMDFINERHPDLAKGNPLALKTDPTLGREAIDWYASKNRGELEAAKLPVSNATLYLAHFLGPEGAKKVLTADPNTPIKSLVGDEAYAANTTKGGGFVYGETAGDVVKNVAQRFGTDVPAMPPGAPQISSPQLPIPAATTPLKALPPNAFDKFDALSVTRPPPMDTGDRITNVLANMAAAAADAKDISSFLASAGAGAAAGASKNISTRRAEDREAAQREDVLKRLQAEVAVRKGEAETQGANFQIQAQNTDNALRQQVATEQAKLDTAAKNKLAEMNYEVDLQKWKLFQPDVKVDKEGNIVVVQRLPNGGMKVDIQKGNDLDAMADKIKAAATVYGPEASKAMQSMALANSPGGEAALKRQIMRDMVMENHVVDVLGPEELKKLEKEAEKGLDQTLRGKPEDWDKQKKQRMLDLLWSRLQGRPELWLPKMLQKGHPGAVLLAQPQS